MFDAYSRYIFMPSSGSGSRKLMVSNHPTCLPRPRNSDLFALTSFLAGATQRHEIMSQRKRQRTSTDTRDTPITKETSRPPRKKSCDKCALSKVRCDHKRPICSRCRLRGHECIYDKDSSINDEIHQLHRQSGCPQASLLEDVVLDQDLALDASVDAPGHFTTDSSSLLDPSPTQVLPQNVAHPEVTGRFIQNGSAYGPSPPLSQRIEVEDFRNISLISTVDHDRVRDRWMAGFLLRPGQRTKNITPGIMQYMFSVLRSYPRKLGKIELPPMIQHMQCHNDKLPLSLANCKSICRMWEGQVTGGEAIVRETIIREMRRLFKEV